MQNSTQKAQVRDHFDASEGWKGKFYRESHDPFGQMLVRRKEHVLRLFKKYIGRTSGPLFDVGCGAGEYLAEIGGPGVSVFGMDASEEMVRTTDALLAGRGWPGRPGLVRGDIDHVPFRSGSFQAVLCIGVIGYLEHDEKALSELHRLVQPGGYLLLNVRNLNALTSFHYHVRVKFRHLLKHGWAGIRSAVSMVTTTGRGGWTSRAYNIRKLETLVASTGFERIEGLTFGYELRPLSMLGVNGRTVVRLETLLEKMMMGMPFRRLRYAGWGYVGVFRKSAA